MEILIGTRPHILCGRVTLPGSSPDSEHQPSPSSQASPLLPGIRGERSAKHESPPNGRRCAAPEPNARPGTNKADKPCAVVQAQRRTMSAWRRPSERVRASAPLLLPGPREPPPHPCNPCPHKPTSTRKAFTVIRQAASQPPALQKAALTPPTTQPQAAAVPLTRCIPPLVSAMVESPAKRGPQARSEGWEQRHPLAVAEGLREYSNEVAQKRHGWRF